MKKQQTPESDFGELANTKDQTYAFELSRQNTQGQETDTGVSITSLDKAPVGDEPKKEALTSQASMHSVTSDIIHNLVDDPE